MDREQVIKGLECCSDVNGKHCYEGKCPYASMSEPCREQLAQDAIILLKEQEAVVRCKDCKYFPSAPQYEPSCWKNRRRGDDPDWYCADGERRTDDA